MGKDKSEQKLTFDEQLILSQYFLKELGIETLSALGRQLNTTEYEGMTESGNTQFYEYISHICQLRGKRVNLDKLRIYDENICRHTRQLSQRRGTMYWKYYQYISLLFTEMYLDRYFTDREAFCADLNEFLGEMTAKSLNRLSFDPYEPEKMNKLAFMCATGSGKTLIMHVNILQYLHYFRRAQRLNSHLSINKIIVLAPNEVMSLQHLEELKLSSISAGLFQKEYGVLKQREDVIVIDMNKLKEEGRVKTVAVDSFEQNNLVLVDEGHRGLSGNIWYDYRTRLSAEGFAFEYSATFKQALNADSKKKEEKDLMEEYGKSIIMDYSYKYFYEDGYGKDYRIYNLQESMDEEQKVLYLTGCLLCFYQQMKLFTEKGGELQKFHIEKPLLVFVGNRVTAVTRKDELTDVEEVLDFIDKFVRNRSKSVERIKAVLMDDTGLSDVRGRDLFYMDFVALNHYFGAQPDAELVFADIMRIVFNTNTSADEPRLHLENIRQVTGEIGMKIGEYGDFFGVISIGDTAGLIKNCERKGIVAQTDEFISESLFQKINEKDSPIKMLIGSRKFTEGWNSWRVSTMGLINFAKGEGAQAIQLFGRGIRLKGYNGCLKRSSRLDDICVERPKYIEVLETLTIFGIKAQYMEDFKRYLELEDVPANDVILRLKLPVVNRYDTVKDKKLRVIRVKNGANFKKQGERLILDVPDQGFNRYLLQSVTKIDCRSKIQTIDSTFSGLVKMESLEERYTLPTEVLPHLDYYRIFDELQIYKSEKEYYNISIIREKLRDILSVDGWYSLIIPRHYLKVDTIEKLEAATDYAVMALKSYMDKFYRYEKERWEEHLLELAELTPSDNNFVDEYSFTYSPAFEQDKTGEELERFIKETNTVLNEDGRLDDYEKSVLNKRILVYDCPLHLYAPLITLPKSSLRIQVAPVSLNESEKRFIDLLEEYAKNHEDELKDKPVYLLRNKSKVGMGFFEAGNFYPDFILWIDTEDTQYITFIDPKGLMHIRPDDPKIMFCKTIKKLEERLAPTVKDKRIVLNSFIMTGTPAAMLKQWWSTPDIEAGRSYREARNVYTLDHPQCIELMIDKILKSG
ncbi:DEAD/DEAH box helicase family protein [Clostridium sp. AM58-1XD]|uniref:DEAD/DEAH box helicase family protein n=1 Tax=Clostridium sp. AM58-1XD TaxID=2292307 RepID=UPI000E47A4AE|nr:DEAD/DEAH box helicase family protein [Clostridium sp. AM58-1XD]RGZ01286.1 restriction endonuclease subunit R [Clostridium sp. AM58-1XD]